MSGNNEVKPEQEEAMREFGEGFAEGFLNTIAKASGQKGAESELLNSFGENVREVGKKLGQAMAFGHVAQFMAENSKPVSEGSGSHGGRTSGSGGHPTIGGQACGANSGGH